MRQGTKMSEVELEHEEPNHEEPVITETRKEEE